MNTPDNIPAPVPPAQPTELAKMVEAAAKEIVGDVANPATAEERMYHQCDVDDTKAILLRHLQPLADELAAVQLRKIEACIAWTEANDKLTAAQELDAARAEVASLTHVLANVKPLDMDERTDFNRRGTIIEADKATIEGLRATVATLTEKLRDAQAENMAGRVALRHVEAERDALQSSQGKDAERLDWLQERDLDWRTLETSDDGDIRAAIDAARAKPEASP